MSGSVGSGLCGRVQVRDEEPLDIGGVRAALGQGVDYVERDARLELAVGGPLDECRGKVLPVLAETEVEDEVVVVGVVPDEE